MLSLQDNDIEGVGHSPMLASRMFASRLAHTLKHGAGADENKDKNRNLMSLFSPRPNEQNYEQFKISFKLLYLVICSSF